MSYDVPALLAGLAVGALVVYLALRSHFAGQVFSQAQGMASQMFESHPPHISYAPPFLTCTMDRIEIALVFSFAEKGGKEHFGRLTQVEVPAIADLQKLYHLTSPCGTCLSAEDMQAYITELIAAEKRIGEALDRIPAGAKEHPGLARAIKDIRDTSKRQQNALEERLKHIQNAAETPSHGGLSKSGEHNSQTLTPTLRNLHGLVDEAALGYAVMHVGAHRAFDSREEGNTADLAEGHLRSYSRTLQVLNRLISDVAEWELSTRGHECKCQCPSCGLGICLCSPHGTNTVGDVWRETATVYAEPTGRGMRIRPPRSKSAASRAGLQAGDILVAIDDREVPDESWDSIDTIQDAVKKHKTGEVIRLKVLHASGETVEVSVERP